MEAKQGQREDAGTGQKPSVEESPAEKLERNPPSGSLIPGPENPESEEIKEEKSPNTE